MQDNKAIVAASSVSLGIFVLLLYALFVTAVFSGFATYIYRTEWQASLSSGQATGVGAAQVVDIDNLIFVIKREGELERSIQQLRAREFELEAEQIDWTATRDIAFGRIAAARTDIANQAFFTLADLRGIADQLTETDQLKLFHVIDNGEIEQTQRALTALQLIEGVRPRGGLSQSETTRFDNTIARLDTDMETLKQAETEHNSQAHRAKAELVHISTMLDRAGTSRADARAQLEALRERVPLGSTDRARLAALSTDVPIVGDMFQRLVSFPTIFLTLIVTIAAGGLGTVVAFSRRYYANGNTADLSLSRLFVNVGEGIASAISIFLFAGAGMLALTQGGGGQNEVELSPYTVAFIAFLSGFMAEDAFASIQAAGKRIFSVDNNSENGDSDNSV